jgi:Sel1 repeat
MATQRKKKSISSPSPTGTLDPVESIKSSISQLGALRKIGEAGDVYRMGKHALSMEYALVAIDGLGSIGPEIFEIVESTIKYITTDENGRLLDSPLALQLIRSAADKGVVDLAYNVGNRLVQLAESSNSLEGFSVAAGYLSKASESASKNSIRASACVNLGLLYARGRLGTGSDFVMALNLYEKAAQLGLVRGMINASSTCHRLSKCKDRVLLDRAVQYLEQAIEATKHPANTVDLGGPLELMSLQREATVDLAALNAEHPRHFVDEIRGAQNVRDFIGSEAGATALHMHDTILRCMGRRLGRLSANKPLKNSGENWRTVLSTIDWIAGDMQSIIINLQAPSGKVVQEVEVSKFDVSTIGHGNVPFLIVENDLLPLDEGLENLTKLGKALAASMPKFFIWGRRPFFQQEGDLIFTYIALITSGDVKLVPLWPGAMPDEVMDCPHLSRDPLHAAKDQTICIAINALNEGIGERIEPHKVMWAGVGGDWRMPFHKESTVVSMRLMPPSGYFDPTVPIAPVLVL